MAPNSVTHNALGFNEPMGQVFSVSVKTRNLGSLKCILMDGMMLHRISPNK